MLKNSKTHLVYHFLFQADLSCRNTTQTVGAIFTRTNFVTLKYVTDNWGTASNGFKLVITAVKDPSELTRKFIVSIDLMLNSQKLTCVTEFLGILLTLPISEQP